MSTLNKASGMPLREQMMQICSLCTSVRRSANTKVLLRAAMLTFDSIFPDSPPKAKLLVANGDYQSTLTTEANISRKIFPQGDRKYFFIQFFDPHDEESGSFLTIRIARDGKIAEVVSLRRSSLLRGNDVLKIFDQLANRLEIKSIYLLDVSRVVLNPEDSESATTADLRVLYAVASESGQVCLAYFRDMYCFGVFIFFVFVLFYFILVYFIFFFISFVKHLLREY